MELERERQSSTQSELKHILSAPGACCKADAGGGSGDLAACGLLQLCDRLWPERGLHLHQRGARELRCQQAGEGSHREDPRSSAQFSWPCRRTRCCDLGNLPALPRLGAHLACHCTQEPLLPSSSSYVEFIVEMASALNNAIVPEREGLQAWPASLALRLSPWSEGLWHAGAIVHLFSDASPVHPTCAGHWLVRAPRLLSPPCPAALHWHPCMSQSAAAANLISCSSGAEQQPAAGVWSLHWLYAQSRGTVEGPALRDLMPLCAWL